MLEMLHNFYHVNFYVRIGYVNFWNPPCHSFVEYQINS